VNPGRFMEDKVRPLTYVSYEGLVRLHLDPDWAKYL
jgi:hypothetical protein